MVLQSLVEFDNILHEVTPAILGRYLSFVPGSIINHFYNFSLKTSNSIHFVEN